MQCHLRSNAHNHNESLLVCTDQVDLTSSYFNSVNVFAAYIAEVFRPDDHFPHLPTPTTAIEDLHITFEAVVTIIVRLDPHKFAGPDGLHANLLHLISPIT